MIYFIYLKAKVTERCGETRGGSKSLIHTLNDHNDWGLVRSKSEASFQLSHVDAKAQAFGPSAAAFPGTYSRELDEK